MIKYYTTLAPIILISICISLNGMHDYLEPKESDEGVNILSNDSAGSAIKSNITAKNIVLWGTRAYLCKVPLKFFYKSYCIWNKTQDLMKNSLFFRPEELIKRHNTSDGLKIFLTEQLQRNKKLIDDIIFLPINEGLASSMLIGSNKIVTYSNEIDNYSSKEIDFIMNHEIAHIKLGHMYGQYLYHFAANMGVEAAFWAIDYG